MVKSKIFVKLMIGVLILPQSLVGATSATAQERSVREFHPIMISQSNTDQVDRAIRMQDLTEAEQREMGTFAGARLRIALGGNRNQPKVRGGLTFAPTMHSRANQGAAEINIGEGLEFGHRSGHRISLSAAGQDIGGNRAGVARAGEEDDNGGLPDWALITGGVVIALGVGGLLFWDALKDASD